MTWQGYPEGILVLYVNGILAGKLSYDSRYDDARDLPQSFSVGMRPSLWAGELVEKDDGTLADLRPGATMSVLYAGVGIRGLRLYKLALSEKEINWLFEGGYEIG
jgi:hypothetical protein